MKKNIIKKSIAALLCCGLCVSTGVFASIAVTKMPEINGKTPYADGHVYWICDGDDVGIEDITESFFAPNGNAYFKYNEKAKDWLMPGGTKSGSLTIANHSESQKATMGFMAQNTGLARGFTEGGELSPDMEVPQEYRDFIAQNSDVPYTPAQLYFLSRTLVESKLKLKVYRVKPGDENKTSPQVHLVYQGMVNGKGAVTNSVLDENFRQPSWYDMTLPSEEDETWDFTVADDAPEGMMIGLGDVVANESVKFVFRLHAPKELKSVIQPGDPEYSDFQKVSGNSGGAGGSGSPGYGGVSPIYNGTGDAVNQGYSHAVAMIDWIFSVSFVDAPTEPSETTTTTTTPTTTTTTTKYTPPTPKTGEAAVPYVVAAGLCGFSALAIFFIAFGNIGKKRKEEE